MPQYNFIEPFLPTQQDSTQPLFIKEEDFPAIVQLSQEYKYVFLHHIENENLIKCEQTLTRINHLKPPKLRLFSNGTVEYELYIDNYSYIQENFPLAPTNFLASPLINQNPPWHNLDTYTKVTSLNTFRFQLDPPPGTYNIPWEELEAEIKDQFLERRLFNESVVVSYEDNATPPNIALGINAFIEFVLAFIEANYESSYVPPIEENDN